MDALFVFLISCLGYSNWFLGKSMLDRPLVTAPLVGLAFGDLTSGCIIGATIELALMGAQGIGAAAPPDTISGSVLGTAFAILSHQDAGTGVALALPISMLGMVIRNFCYIVLIPLINRNADTCAERGDADGVCRVHIVSSVFGFILPQAIYVTIAFVLGAPVVEGVLAAIPEFVQHGLSVAAGILPALGFVILLRTIMDRSLIAYLIFGFVLSAYLGVPILGVALIAGGVVLIMIFKDREAAPLASFQEGDDDNEF